MFNFDLQDIFQWVECGQIYAVHQTHLVQSIDPHDSQFCDAAQHSRGLKEMIKKLLVSNILRIG